MYRNLFRLALRSIRSRRMRSWLTILGVLIGVTAVTALLSIGTGVRVAVLKQFEAIGYDIVMIVPEGARAVATRLAAPPSAAPASTGGVFSPEGLKEGGVSAEPSATSGARSNLPLSGRTSPASSLDVSRLLEQVPALAEAGVLGLQVAAVTGPRGSGYLRVLTPTAGFLAAFPSVLPGFDVAQGTSFNDSTQDQVVVGPRAATTLGVGLGDSLTVAGRTFLVVGVLAPSGAALQSAGQGQLSGSGQRAARGLTGGGTGIAAFRSLANTADALVVLGERAREIWPTANTTTITVARVKAGTPVGETVDAIRVAVAEQGASGTPVSVQEIADQIQGTLQMIETVLACIAAVALLVGSVGLMNTMYTAVLERTREIGILKAIGARDGQVMVLFIVDSGLMGLLGGILGLLLGGALSVVAARVFGRALGVGVFFPIFRAGLIGGVLGLSFVVGGLSGAWPAWRAARLNPVEALTGD